jgi:hypothetical protein
MLNQFKAKTQFIVITHNPRTTTEAADAVYGVTMQEPGVSSVVSVRLRGAATGTATGTATNGAANGAAANGAANGAAHAATDGASGETDDVGDGRPDDGRPGGGNDASDAALALAGD